MRYQRPFPNVIPHAKVGCSRVTHPSATKLFQSKLLHNSVRLECVMHAASVHPEPGSNSRLFCIKITLSSVPILSSFFSQLLLLFCLSSILFQNLTRYFFRTILSSAYFSVSSLCTSSISCCSIFNDRFRCLQNIQLCQYITNATTLSSTFLTFFQVFFSLGSASFATLLYYHIPLPLSIPF